MMKALTHKELQAAVIGLARVTGWREADWFGGVVDRVLSPGRRP